MVLIRKLVLLSLKLDIQIFCRWVMGSENKFADFLSRMKIDQFKTLAKEEGKLICPEPTPLHADLWPASKFWLK